MNVRKTSRVVGARFLRQASRLISGPRLGRLCIASIASILFVMPFAHGRTVDAYSGVRVSRHELDVSLTPVERAYLRSLPALRLGIDPHWAPMAFVDKNEQPSGISAEYLMYIEQTLGIRLRVVPTKSWADTISLANDGGVDVIAAASVSEGLSNRFQLTTPYQSYPLVIVTKETTPFVGGLSDLAGSRVAVVSDSEPVQGDLQGLKAMQVTGFHSAEEGLDAVASGKAFAYIGNLAVIDRLLREKYAGVLRVAAPTGFSQSLSLGVDSRYSRQLVPLINRVLQAIPNDERIRVQNDWLSSRFVFGVPAHTLWLVLLPITIIVLVLLALLGWIIRRLRAEVRQRRWTELELTFQTQFQKLLMDTVPIPIFVKDMQGRYVAVNPAYEETLGVSAEQILGMTAATGNHLPESEDAIRLNAISGEVIRTGQSAHGEVQFRGADGEKHDAVFWLKLCQQKHEAPRAVLGAFVDVSDLRKMERREIELKQQLLELTQVLPAVVFQLLYVRGAGFSLRFINQRAFEILKIGDVRPDDVLRAFWGMLGVVKRGSIVKMFLRSMRRLEIVRRELQLQSVDGNSKWLHIEAAPQRCDDGSVVWSGYLHDVTEARERNAALAAAKYEAEEALKAKDSFLATVSHEIRTPMSGVVGILQLLDHGRLSGDDQHLLDMARNAAGILVRILNDILDFAKSQNGELTLESAPMSVPEIVDRIAGIVAPEIERKKLRFDVRISPLTAAMHLGDGQRLGQVLLNLLTNATKFTEKGAITLSLSAATVTKGRQDLTIQVEDTGIGIDMAGRAKLFSPFTQVHAAPAHKYGGTGLGLAICKRLIESMAGIISVHSVAGQGTSVTLRLSLPVHQLRKTGVRLSSSADARARVGAVTPRETDGRILLVEDQALNRELLLRQMASLRIKSCDVASNGIEALQVLDRNTYAMVITDCAMPFMDGVELIRRIRQREQETGAQVPLVALTANATKHQYNECMDAGADEVIVKPVDLGQLRSLLDRFGITAPPIEGLAKAGIPADRHTDLWEKLARTLVGEINELLALSLDRDSARAREILHRMMGTASWFHLAEVAQSAAHLDECLSEGLPATVHLYDLQAAVMRATTGPTS